MVQTKHKHFNTLMFFNCKSNSRYRDRQHYKFHIHSVHSRLTRGRFVPTLFFSGGLYPHRKVIRHMTSDFDLSLCEFDLDMQMSFVNTAPWIESMSKRLPYFSFLFEVQSIIGVVVGGEGERNVEMSRECRRKYRSNVKNDERPIPSP